MGRIATAPRPAIPSLAGDLALNDATLCEALHQRRILLVGLPKMVDPLTPSPTPYCSARMLSQEPWVVAVH
jgi:hypothetical protein